MDHLVYLDNSATTRVSEPVLRAMLPFLTKQYGNPSSIYTLGQQAKAAIEEAREKVAKAINAKPREIFFTSCGTESDNWAIRGTARRMAAKGKKHLVTSAFEHHAVLHACKALEREGFEVTYLPVSADGLVDPAAVAAAIRPDTALVTIMYANNEIGTIQPIGEIGKICREKGVWFHTDAVQALGNVRIDVAAEQIEMLSLSGHKIHAPKGVGALYIRQGVLPESLMEGGGQESRRRPGTENTASIVGLGQAVEDAYADFDEKIARMAALRDRLIDGLLKIPDTRLNGSRERRLCTNVNVSFKGIEGEGILLWLDMNGVAASSGSACTSGSLDPSHVLLAIGLDHGTAHGSLRLSLGRYNTDADVDHVLAVLPGIIARLRELSPVYQA